MRGPGQVNVIARHHKPFVSRLPLLAFCACSVLSLSSRRVRPAALWLFSCSTSTAQRQTIITMGSERWERDRVYERDRYDDDRFYMKGGRGRERSEDGYDRRRYHDDDLVSDRRYYEQDSPYSPRREPARQPEYERRVVMERERDREDFRESSPRRPGFLRRQSSLDTFDRRPLRHVLHQREEYPPPARREDIYRDDYRAPPYAPIPLPRTRGLPPPGRRQDRHYDDYRPEHFHDDEFRPLPERIREREVVRERDRRDPSRDSRTTRTHSRRSASRSSSSRSSSSSGGTAIHSQYPKRGKTKIPARLVSKRALIDLGYPFFEEVSITRHT